MWTIAIPIGCFSWFGVLRDNLRYVCIPIMIATAVFQIMIVLVSIVVLYYATTKASHWYVITAHWVNLLVLFFSLYAAICYYGCCSKRDLTKTDEEEID